MSRRVSEPGDLNGRGLRDRAVAAARGDVEFDLLIVGGEILDVVTNEIYTADVGLVGPLIASVHGMGTRTDAAKTLDATGKYISPGLIDTHMHVESSMVTPAVYAKTVLARGVTSVVWDPHELANVHGLSGVNWAIKTVADLDLRFMMLAPSCVPSAVGQELSGAQFDRSELETLLALPQIYGVAEVMNMGGVIGREQRITDILQAGLTSTKPIHGHARSLSGADLMAYVAGGISSDHELISGEDLLEKLRAGLSIELRGSHDHLLPQFVEVLKGLGQLPQSVTLCSDDVFPDDLEQGGGVDDVVRRLVKYGLPPLWAVQAATLNGARRLGRADLGLIAPGKRADLVLFDDLEDFRADHVIVNGVPVAKQGKLNVVQKNYPTTELQNSVKCAHLGVDDFKIASKGKRVRLASIERPRFTRWGEVEANVENGCVVPPAGVTLISVIHRHGRTKPVPQVGYLWEWGQWRGAFCTTVSHDSHNLTVFGGNEKDMAIAANRVVEQGGGMAVAAQGKIVATLSLPLSGLMSEASLSEVSADFASIRKAMENIVDWKPPLLVFKACFGATLACNAGPHQTDMGIADVARDGPMINPVLEILQT